MTELTVLHIENAIASPVVPHRRVAIAPRLQVVVAWHMGMYSKLFKLWLMGWQRPC
jgi:hypothetical protein